MCVTQCDCHFFVLCRWLICILLFSFSWFTVSQHIKRCENWPMICKWLHDAIGWMGTLRDLRRCVDSGVVVLNVCAHTGKHSKQCTKNVNQSYTSSASPLAYTAHTQLAVFHQTDDVFARDLHLLDLKPMANTINPVSTIQITFEFTQSIVCFRIYGQIYRICSQSSLKQEHNRSIQTK